MSGTVTETADGVPPRLAAIYLPADLPRQGRIAFWDPEGAPLPGTATEDLTVVRRHGAGVRRRQVPALTLPLGEALPLLVRARRDPAAHPATACWGAAAQHALRLAARGRLLPGLTPARQASCPAG
ncbi:ATP-dependent helicase, partial [Streptomyces sp. NPDC005917]